MIKDFIHLYRLYRCGGNSIKTSLKEAIKLWRTL